MQRGKGNRVRDKVEAGGPSASLVRGLDFILGSSGSYWRVTSREAYHVLSAFLRAHVGCWQRALDKLIWKTVGLDSVIANFQKRQRCQNLIPAH